MGSEEEKPAVWIFACAPVPTGVVSAILWGLEEEGIPAEVREVPPSRAKTLAKQAAVGSRLDVGIGVSGFEKKVVLHHRDLPDSAPLFDLAIEGPGYESLRQVGANAARLVKGDPLAYLD
ncbi:MAG: glycerol dehydratase reactivase beta/small subunit family protein [Deltaproteobacteria bacterium]|nr:glycerol dehydratase reactivase beta/small subunit family protein [Deltaproteobacteria bacterium]